MYIIKKICLGKGILFWVSGTFRHNVGSDDDDDDMINIFCLVRINIMMEKTDYCGSRIVVEIFLRFIFGVDHT
jgi:hypothetical protein